MIVNKYEECYLALPEDAERAQQVIQEAKKENKGDIPIRFGTFPKTIHDGLYHEYVQEAPCVYYYKERSLKSIKAELDAKKEELLQEIHTNNDTINCAKYRNESCKKQLTEIEVMLSNL